MKILHIIPAYLPAYRYGGPIWSVHSLNKWLVKKGIEVTVYTTNIDGRSNLDVPLDREVLRDGVKIYYYPVSFRPWQYSEELRKHLRDNIKKFDLVHITSVFLAASTLGAFYAKKFRKPYIISPRGSLMKEPLRRKSRLKKQIYLSLREKRNLRFASAVHFTTELEKQEYIELGLPLKKAIVISNGLDAIADFEPDNVTGRRVNFRQRFGIDDDKKIILFLSRLSWKKGFDTLIPALARVVKKEPQAILVLVGGDDEGYKKTIDSLIGEYNLREKVIFTGMLTGGDKKAAFEEGQVFTLPSYSENFGMAVVEAMAFGLPVVITKNVGVASWVVEAGAGLVIEKDIRQLAEAVLKILGDQMAAREMAKRGKELVSVEFNWLEIARRFKNEYNQLVSNYG